MNNDSVKVSNRTKIRLGLCASAGLALALLVFLPEVSDTIIHFGLLHSPWGYTATFFILSCLMGYGYSKTHKSSWWLGLLIGTVAATLAFYFMALCIKSLCIYAAPETFCSGIMIPGPVEGSYIVNPQYDPLRSIGMDEKSFVEKAWCWLTGKSSLQPEPEPSQSLQGLSANLNFATEEEGLQCKAELSATQKELLLKYAESLSEEDKHLWEKVFLDISQEKIGLEEACRVLKMHAGI